jgi:hypothetical protein
VLHELAHTCTITVDGDEDGHGPDFMGVYLQLLDQVGNIPLCYIDDVHVGGTPFAGNVHQLHLAARPCWLGKQ